MLTFMLATSAMAQGLVPTYDLPTERDYKIEVIYQNPDMQESANHQKADAELWGGHIRCKVHRKAPDQCRLFQLGRHQG